MTERSSFESLLRSPRTVWVVGVFAFMLFLVTDLPWQLDDYDQAKQAFTSFEIVKEGHWFYQRTPHEHVATKPPLVAWISAGLFTITRSWEGAWRLPSLLAAAVISVFLFRCARSAYGPAAGLIALSAFSFNLLTPRLAGLVRTDMPLCFVTFLSGLLIWQKVRAHDPWTLRDRLMIFGLLTAGLMIKGPIIYAFLLPGIIGFQARRRRNGDASAWPGWWPWVASLALFLVWVWIGSRVVPDFYNEVVLREFAGRFGGDVHRAQPWYFYFPHLLHKFAPWSIVLLVLAVSSFRASSADARGFFKMPADTCWLICWSVGGLIVMSLLPSKRVDRIFPIIPPLCLFLGAQVARSLSAVGSRARAYRWASATLAAALLFSGGYALWKVTSAHRNHNDALVNFGRAVRAQAAANHWRYEVLNGPDEGLLLYSQKLHFARPEQAIAEWNCGNLDALVVPGREALTMMHDLENAVLSPGPSMPGGEYVLIRR